MRRLICYCLILCFIFTALPACAPQAPTADVHVVLLGDTEKQVIEKAGYPDEYVGGEEDIYCYYTNEAQTQYKLLWFSDEKVTIIATMDKMQFTDWEIDATHTFEPLTNAKDVSFWRSDMDLYDLIRRLGFGYESIEYYGSGIISTLCTYPLEKGCKLKANFSSGTLDYAVIVNADGSKTVVWQPGVLKKDGTPVL